ncbi:putative Histidine kinase [Microcystis aeruginosa PCC 9806]|uniref:histidine kinase n=3 Tax=Microcystis TaxID=1125 RepID=A0A6H9GRW8_MICAE|nr:ATP-binding protein [Microcystis aeruginosa]TRV20430.1 MAG: two-component sensor histidine kinase [Microcystis flos-aquae Mf_WU_F_19750830_S460]GCL48976.1 PAS/PAC sensor signal transduction histidine kinase [Microcystis aeruginosa NIES-3804]CCI16790.1 putative Histidine kinase [Microcystis aeruginosa PCC 9806]
MINPDIRHSVYLLSSTTERHPRQVNQQLEVRMRQKNQELAEGLQKLQSSAEKQTLDLEKRNVGLWDWDIITAPEYPFLYREKLAAPITQNSCTPCEKKNIRSDGNLVPVIMGYGVVAPEKGKMVAILLDLTPAKEAEREMLVLNQTLTKISQLLAKRNQELERFAYVVSHDLKAPLRAIANLSQWLEEDLEENLTEETRHNLQLLQQRVYRLKSMIEGLLDYSRIGLSSLPEETVNLTELIEEIIASLAIPPDFIIEVKSPLPTLVTQRLLLSQVFSNLISNAIKHHDDNHGQIEIQAIDRGDYYEFSVKDDGPGIAPEYQEKIFEVFQILNSRDQTENTGIGLSIVKKILDDQEERIWVESPAGEGATFYFTWQKNPPS